MYNNLRNIPPYPTNVDEIRIAGLTAYTAVTNSALENGLRSQAESIVNTKDANDRTIVKTYSFASGAKIQDLLYYPSSPTGKVLFEVRGAYADLTGLPLQIGGAYDIGYEGRYTNARSIAYERKANEAITKAIVTNIDGTVFTDTYIYPNAASTEPDRIDQGVATIPQIGFALSLSASAGATDAPVTLIFNFPVVHPACRLVPTVYGGSGIFNPSILDVAANASQATVTFTPSPTTTNTIVAFGTTNDAGLRNPGYQAYVIGATAAGQPPGTGQSPVPDSKLRERAIRTAVTLDNARRPTAIVYYYADNSQILDRYRYASIGDLDPTEILFDTTPSAAFPGDVVLTPSGTPITYTLNLRELAVRAFSVIDSVGRATQTTYRFANGATIIDRHRFASLTDVDPTESLFDTTTSAQFLGAPIAIPASSGNLGSRLREQAAGQYSTLDAQGRASDVVYYYGDFTRVLDRYRYASVTDVVPTEILFNTTASATFPGAPTGTITGNVLGTSFREQASSAYNILNASGQAERTTYSFPSKLVLDKYSYASNSDSIPIEANYDTTAISTFANAGSSPIATSYHVKVPEMMIRNQVNEVEVSAINPFDAGTIITPSVTGIAGSFSTPTIAAGGSSSVKTNFTPTAIGIGTLSTANNKGLPVPAASTFLVAHQALVWQDFTGTMSAVGNSLTIPVVDLARAFAPLTPEWSDIQFLVDLEKGFGTTDFSLFISDNDSDFDLSSIEAGTGRIFVMSFNSHPNPQFSTNESIGMGQERDGNGVLIRQATNINNANKIVSIQRTGNNITVRSSPDGVTWTTLASASNLLGTNTQYYLKVVKRGVTDGNGTSVAVRPIILSPVIF